VSFSEGCGTGGRAQLISNTITGPSEKAMAAFFNGSFPQMSLPPY
jgi:hypothetical protein